MIDDAFLKTACSDHGECSRELAKLGAGR